MYQLAAPKAKYIEAILGATHGGEAGVGEVFRILQNRLRDSTWTIAFKSLIVIHLMIREGEPDVTLKFIADNPRQLAISNFTEVQVQGGNIRSYDNYLLERARAYRDTKTDHVRAGVGRLKRLSVDKGLLRETESVQHQIRACLKCDLLSTESDNEITLTAFRLLTMDLLVLFSVMNEGTINVLERYFEMSRPDAERALQIYKTFSRQTDQVVQFLSVARQYELSTRLEIPKLKHAPTSLTNSLEEYLNDPDFEVNRRQYLAQQQAKKSGVKFSAGNTSTAPKGASALPASKSDSTFPAMPVKGPAPDLMDFFESIEQNQQPIAQQPNGLAYNGFQQAPQQQPYQAAGFPAQQNAFSTQQTGYPPPQQPVQQNTNPFGQPQSFAQQNTSPFPQQPQAQPQPLQPDFTGAGFGGYTPQPQSYFFQSSLSSIPQEGVASFQQQQQQQPPPQNDPNPQQSSNPFRQSMMLNQQTGSSGISSPLTRQSTNPFAKNVGVQSTGQSFGSNSPFTSPPPQPGNQSSFFGQQSPPLQSPPMLQPQRTGTNPFVKNPAPVMPSNPSGQPAAAPLRPNPTGSTNPFRQSAFVNQETGQAWQQTNQGTFGGFGVDNVQTNPIFPRPGQTT